MIKVTLEAAKQILISAQQGNIDNSPLRIAATKNDDGSFHYGMGFDENKENDIAVKTEGIDVVIAPESAELLKNTTLDFVELEAGKMQFIFMNPNDPDYTPPSDS